MTQINQDITLSHVQLFVTPLGCSPAGSSVHGILQARTLEWVAISFSRGSSQPRDWTWATYIAGGFFTTWDTRKAQYDPRKPLMKECKLGDRSSFTGFLGSDPGKVHMYPETYFLHLYEW